MKQLTFTTIALAGVAILIAISGWPAPRSALACSGGLGPLEFFAPSADLIFLGTVIEAGDSTNRAPIVTPTRTPHPSVTPEAATPVSPPIPPTPFFIPVPTIELAGIDAVLKVDETYAGQTAATYATGQEARRQIEADLRNWEAGYPQISSCSLDAFVPRYESGGQYLLFVEQDDTEYVQAVFRIEGDQVVLDDPLLNAASQGYLQTEEGTFERFFPGIPSDGGNGASYPTSNRVPLDALLAAVAHLRGDTTIQPPDAGNAGLKREH